MVNVGSSEAEHMSDGGATLSAAYIVWSAAGSPLPCDTLGGPLLASADLAHCAKCNASGARYSRSLLVSESFLPTRNANRLHAFGGETYCAACVFAAKTLRLRCISWFASAEGVRFWRTRPVTKDAPRPDALAALLDPPKPPFVCGVPLYGIAHGGEAHYRRTWWPGEPARAEPLIRLQSKHVALYARVALSRERYQVQVDDAGEFLLDRPTWLRLRDAAHVVMLRLVDDGVPPFPAKKALSRLRLPSRVSAATARDWSWLTAPLLPHVGATWYPTFCELLPTLEIEDAESDQRSAVA